MKLNRKLRMGMVGGGRGAFIGSVHRMAARLDGDLFLDATEQDVALAGKLLDCFRTYRKRKRITVDQARAILRGWLRYHPEVWRESARRYQLQSSTKDEKYFEGICRRVARDSAVDASSVAVALPL